MARDHPTSGTQKRTSASSASVSLLEAHPEMERSLTAVERTAASRVRLPVHPVASGHVDLGRLLAEAKAIGLFVLEGMLLQRLSINDRITLLLLGPGDLFIPSKEPETALPIQLGCSATAGTRLALLDQHALTAARRWPHITSALLRRMGQQTERVAVQLAVAHLPRVDERLLAIMALLGERWGHLTSDGTMIPLVLTHETLGGLIGSRRSSVTIALSRLAERGHLLKHDRGWLLRHQPRDPGRPHHDQATR
jgi:CRP/FNR family transcriptional regulator, cyclic AMP receptor protein